MNGQDYTDVSGRVVVGRAETAHWLEPHEDGFSTLCGRWRGARLLEAMAVTVREPRACGVCDATKARRRR